MSAYPSQPEVPATFNSSQWVLTGTNSGQYVTLGTSQVVTGQKSFTTQLETFTTGPAPQYSFADQPTAGYGFSGNSLALFFSGLSYSSMGYNVPFSQGEILNNVSSFCTTTGSSSFVNIGLKYPSVGLYTLGKNDVQIGCTGTTVTSFTSTGVSMNVALTTTGTVRHGTLGTNFTNLEFGTYNGMGPTGTVSFTNAFGSAPVVTTTMVKGPSSYAWFSQVTSISSSSFQYAVYFGTIGSGAGIFYAGGTDAYTFDWIAIL